VRFLTYPVVRTLDSSSRTSIINHCINRCVRRAYLCGDDHLTGKNYEHRKTWVVERLAELASVFAIEVYAYAVMSNHYHIVLRVNKEITEDWVDKVVIEHWQQLFKLPLIVFSLELLQLNVGDK